jgi:hypothetical protein
LKRANNQGIWQANQGRKPPRKDRVRRRAMQEDEEAVCCPGPITVSVPRAENLNRNSPRRLDTPAASPPTPSTSRSERTDPSYVPPDTPCSRRKLGTARSQPPSRDKDYECKRCKRTGTRKMRTKEIWKLKLWKQQEKVQNLQ